MIALQTDLRTGIFFCSLRFYVYVCAFIWFTFLQQIIVIYFTSSVEWPPYPESWAIFWRKCERIIGCCQSLHLSWKYKKHTKRWSNNVRPCAVMAPGLNHMRLLILQPCWLTKRQVHMIQPNLHFRILRKRKTGTGSYIFFS